MVFLNIVIIFNEVNLLSIYDPQSNEVGNSVRMEKEGLSQSLVFLEESGVKVACLVTDRHTQVQKFIREERPNSGQ